MKTQENSKDQKENTKNQNKAGHNIVCECDEACYRRGKRNLLLICFGFIILFVGGYLINPSILKNIWLIITGTLAIITCLLLFLIQVRIVTIKC